MIPLRYRQNTWWPAALSALAILLTPPGEADAGLDPSWSHLLLHLWDEQSVFGQDFIFTYGPLGPLFASSGLPLKWWWVRTLFLLLIGRLWFDVVREIGEARGPLWGWVALLLLLIALPFFNDILSSFVLLVLMIRLAHWGNSSGKLGRGGWAVTGLTAILCLTKLNIAIPALAGWFIAWAFSDSKEDRWPWILALLGFLGLGCMILPISWGYVFENWDIVSGYSHAMWWPVDETTAYVALSGTCAAIFWLSVTGEDVKSVLQRFLLAVVFLGILFRSAFTRGDFGHQLLLVGLLPLLPVALLGLNPRMHPRWAWLSIALSLWGFQVFHGTRPDSRPLWQVWGHQMQIERWTPNLSPLEELSFLAKVPDLICTTVGDASVDVFPYQLDLALLNDMNCTSRPIPQSYSVYTRRLEQKNATHYAGEDAPEFVIFQARHPSFAIDNRPVFNDDFPVIELLRNRYEPVDTAAWTVLLKGKQEFHEILLQKSDSAREPLESALSAIEWQNRQILKIPDQKSPSFFPVLELSGLELTWQNRLRSLFFRTQEDMSHVTAFMPDGRVERRRLSPRSDGSVRVVLAFPRPQDNLACLWNDGLPQHFIPDSIALSFPPYKSKVLRGTLRH